MPDWSVKVRDATGAIIAPVVGWSSLHLEPVFSDVGLGTATIPAELDAADLLLPPNGLVVYLDGAPFMSGPITSVERTVDDTSTAGTLTVIFLDDLVWLRDKMCAPDPTSALDSQGVTAYDTVAAGTAEGAATYFVSRNVGKGALYAPRRVGPLTVATSQGRGTGYGGYAARWDNVLDLAQRILAPYGLGMRALQQGDSVIWSVFQPRDVSADVFFSLERHNLSGYHYSYTPADANVFLVGAQGQGTARSFTLGTNTASVAASGRQIETFVDRRDTNDATAIAQEIAQQIAQHPDVEQVDGLTVLDSEQATFGVDYGPLDKVGVRIGSRSLLCTVSGAVIDVAPDTGTTRQLTLTTATLPPSGPLRVFQTVADLQRRLANIERRQ